MGNFFVRYVYGALNDYGIDTKDMEPYEAIEKYNSLIEKGEIKDNLKETTQNDKINIQNLSKSLTNEKWEQSLSNQEKEAIRWYTNYSDTINNYLRGNIENVNPVIINRINCIDNAIDSFELSEPISVYRNISEKYDRQQSYKEKGYTSTSISEQSVLNRANDNDLIYVYDIPAGKGYGAYINNFSSYKNDEYEFLIGSGTKFEEVDRRVKNGVTYVKWRIIE